MNLSTNIRNWFDENTEVLIALSDAIFQTPELAYEESIACQLLKDYMKEQGFQVTQALESMPTSFIATYSHTSSKTLSISDEPPVLGFLAEYDALPGLGQSVCTDQSPLEGSGHGCGHNLLGVGAVAAACALKAYLETEDCSATIICYGCPAEEILSGKIIMNEHKLFDNLDVAITWHPFDRNRVSNDIWQAIDIKNYKFYGRTSHASKSPELGRSALDAAELMNVGVNYLREHVADDVRMHYAYKSALAPANIVPDYVETNYFIRAAAHKRRDDASRRVDNCAHGAALMTDTKVEIELISSCKEIKVNPILTNTFYQAMSEIDVPTYTESEYTFAKEISQSANLQNNGVYFLGLEPLEAAPVILSIGTDVADVSHVVPTITLSAACMCRGTALHHWATTAQVGMGIGHKGMLYAATCMAHGATYLINDSSLLVKAKEIHEQINN